MYGQYFDWLSSKFHDCNKYSLLFMKLYSTNFEWFIPFDENRAGDGINLRYRFGRENDIPDPVICATLDDRPCSILEMMIALGLRIEEQIMGDAMDQASQWIGDMLKNLGLAEYTNTNYNEEEVDRIIYIFLNRKYSRTGKGGLFEVPDLSLDRDMRTAEIWCQMCWYLNEH